MNLADLLVDQRERPEGEQENLHEDNDLDHCNGQEDETTATLRASLALTSPGSLHYHHISFMLLVLVSFISSREIRRGCHHGRTQIIELRSITCPRSGFKQLFDYFCSNSCL